MSSESILALGFKGDLLKELKSKMPITYSISNDSNADITWDDFYSLKFDITRPDFSEEISKIFREVKKNYCQFNDIYSRRFFYVTESCAEVYSVFTLYFYQCISVLKNNSVNCIIFSNVPHEGYDYIFYLIAKNMSIKTIICNQSLFPNRFWIFSAIEDFGNFASSPKVSEHWSSNYVLPKPSEWVNMQGRLNDRSYFILDFIKEILRKPHRLPLALVRLFHGFQYRINVHKAVIDPVANERYVYFPLHLQPELTTSALGGEFADQISAIEELSSILPNDLYLYVKENPKQNEAYRGKLFFKRLKKLKNVRYIKRTYSSSKLIQDSEFVAVINGTAGWEAIFAKKSILIFGYAWFSSFKGVTRYAPTISVDDVLKNRPANAIETINYLDDILTKTGIGIVDDDYISIFDQYDVNVNSKTVTNSLITYYKFKN
ncbi:capsular biosynthesis protein [Polynucleobacter sp. UB-Tiil-W10]|uniref:capsular polysaccharide export protein, LipB/KpsS family n=1 Tax=Polynucleobacter sp. UB-Tiil-W10 TaxID=1855648 RepID=UPI001C0C2A3F|nr:capsular biosynthesis protein [Polynucleobacter sp. UB-Tiil-W10]MBU3540802.1 hypothetical protein [Polynucleobacter sp. UB-Tiil-W10]